MTPIAGLVVESLVVRRGERELLGGLSFSVGAGRAVVLTGPNGVGKTSLLRAIAGFIRPARGRIRYLGESGDLSPDEARREQCQLVGHQDGLAAGRTARAELEFAVAWSGGDRHAALRAAGRLAIERVLDLEVKRLSAGQRRRVALARLIAAPRTLWLLDEPLAPLDRASRDLFGEAMAAHLASGGLIVAAAHDDLPVAAAILAIEP